MCVKYVHSHYYVVFCCISRPQVMFYSFCCCTFGLLSFVSTVNISCMYSAELMRANVWSIYLRHELPGHRVYLCSTSVDAAKLFS